jgi:hypothetical protein
MSIPIPRPVPSLAPLDGVAHRALSDEVNRLGLLLLCARIGLSPAAITRALAGLPSTRPTRTMVRLYLESVK